MKYLIWGVGGLSVILTLFAWAGTEMPGGEKRYQQFLRLTMERHSFPGGNLFR